jgi:Ca-activated chloride channel family protein
MNGQKISDAKDAILKLLSRLSSNDRFALVSYSDGVTTHCRLLNMTQKNREFLKSAVNSICEGGGTNLGAGLEEGIRLLLERKSRNNMGRIVLISDGLANQGITDVSTLGNMASSAVRERFSISSVGVGNDFNEYLMTKIADRGAGNYYYMENPAAFAQVFERELNSTRMAAATDVQIWVPINEEFSLIDAAGYPIEMKNNHAVFYPGDLLSGQTIKLFLTLEVLSAKNGTFEIPGINVRYIHRGKPCQVTLSESLYVTFVDNKKEAIASVDKVEWEERVIDNDFNRLKEEVARFVSEGKKKDALGLIQDYRSSQQELNAVVQSSRVKENLEKDLIDLNETVEDTFRGSPASVIDKQKKNSKILQYEGYKARRNK